MKNLALKNLIAIALFSISAIAFGQKFESPVLISSAGQSADVKLVKMLAARQKLDATTVVMATKADLEGKKTLVIVPGFSSKGLGAAGISQEDELKRVADLIKAANTMNIPIIMMHIGGNARRFGQSDAFNTLVGNNAKHMIVVAQGDEDKFFTNLAAENKIPIEIVGKIAESGVPLANLLK